MKNLYFIIGLLILGLIGCGREAVNNKEPKTNGEIKKPRLPKIKANNKAELLAELEKRKNSEPDLVEAFLSVDPLTRTFVDFGEDSDHTNLDTLAKWVYDKLKDQNEEKNFDNIYQAFRAKTKSSTNKSIMTRRLIKEALKESGDVFTFTYRYSADIDNKGIEALKNNVIAHASKNELDITKELFLNQNLFPGQTLSGFGKLDEGFLPLQIAKRLPKDALKAGTIRASFIDLMAAMKALALSLEINWLNYANTIALNKDFIALVNNDEDALYIMQIKPNKDIFANVSCDPKNPLLKTLTVDVYNRQQDEKLLDEWKALVKRCQEENPDSAAILRGTLFDISFKKTWEGSEIVEDLITEDKFGLVSNNGLRDNLYRIEIKGPSKPVTIQGSLLYVMAKKIASLDLKEMNNEDKRKNLLAVAESIKAILGKEYEDHLRAEFQSDFSMLSRKQTIIDALTVAPLSLKSPIAKHFWLKSQLEPKDIVTAFEDPDCDDNCRKEFSNIFLNSLKFNISGNLSPIVTKVYDNQVKKIHTSESAAKGLLAITNVINIIDNPNVDWSGDTFSPFGTGLSGSLLAKVAEKYLLTYNGNDYKKIKNRDALASRAAFSSEAWTSFVSAMKKKIGENKWQGYIDKRYKLMNPDMPEVEDRPPISVKEMIEIFGKYDLNNEKDVEELNRVLQY